MHFSSVALKPNFVLAGALPDQDIPNTGQNS